jgi:hypothetical protein
MDAFISAWNENAEPFVWTKKKPSSTHHRAARMGRHWIRLVRKQPNRALLARRARRA